MKTIEKITAKIKADSKLSKAILVNSYYSENQFISDCKTYIKAVKEGRMLCNIVSVSSSGMSRTINFRSCEKSPNGYYFRNYYALFKSLGYTEKKHGFLISGCGMDMIFHTNYSIITRLYHLGFIDKKQADVLRQKTPTVI